MFVRGPRAKIFSVRNDHGKGSAPGARGMRRAETGETERTTDVLIDSRGPVARYIPPDASPREGVSSNLPAKNDNLSQTGISAERRRASCSCAMLTWTLDALRAATEPVKEEAMQAIFEVWICVGVQRTCAGMAQMKPRTRLSYRTADSKRDQYRRGEIKYRALIGANRESPLITRKSRFCLGQLKA